MLVSMALIQNCIILTLLEFLVDKRTTASLSGITSGITDYKKYVDTVCVADINIPDDNGFNPPEIYNSASSCAKICNREKCCVAFTHLPGFDDMCYPKAVCKGRKASFYTGMDTYIRLQPLESSGEQSELAKSTEYQQDYTLAISNLPAKCPIHFANRLDLPMISHKLQCAEMCSMYDWCLTFNYDQVSSICKLNSAEIGSYVKSL